MEPNLIEANLTHNANESGLDYNGTHAGPTRNGFRGPFPLRARLVLARPSSIADRARLDCTVH
eukprot:9534980-Lingulodinium_polyedra.AAC.1